MATDHDCRLKKSDVSHFVRILLPSTLFAWLLVESFFTLVRRVLYSIKLCILAYKS